MLGTDKSRGYCLEMICADFLAGASLDNEDPSLLLQSMARYFKFLPGEQRQAFLGGLSEKTSRGRSTQNPRLGLDPEVYEQPAFSSRLLSRTCYLLADGSRSCNLGVHLNGGRSENLHPHHRRPQPNGGPPVQPGPACDNALSPLIAEGLRIRRPQCDSYPRLQYAEGDRS